MLYWQRIGDPVQNEDLSTSLLSEYFNISCAKETEYFSYSHETFTLTTEIYFGFHKLTAHCFCAGKSWLKKSCSVYPLKIIYIIFKSTYQKRSDHGQCQISKYLHKNMVQL